MMKSKKFGALVLAVVMIASTLAGCGGSSSSSASAPAPTGSSSTASTPAPAPELPTKMEGDDFNNGAIGKHGGVSSVNEFSSQAGIDILKAGGNAVDAAVATAFAAGVVEPNLSGIGGCGMMTVYLKETNEYLVLEYMETVPNAVTPGWFNPDTDGATAKNAAVPSQVHGLLTALEKYGTMTREQVMAPAIKLAKEGWKLDKRLADSINSSFDKLSVMEGAKNIYTNDGLPWAEGDLFKNADLAATLEAVSKGGIEEFYKGETAKKIVDGLRAGGSLITMEDMAAYETAMREPITTTYHGYTVVTPPPPSNGGDWLLLMLNILENYDLKAMGVNSAEYLKVFNEACRIGLVDSYTYIGDPAFFELPIKELTSKEYAKKRMELIKMDKAMDIVPVTDLPVKKLQPTAEDSKHTTHIAVIDEKGNIVSTTNTLGLGWGCQYIVPGTGFFFNSHISNIEHDPAKSDSPDFVAPGKRVRSTISPSLVLDPDNDPVMAIGSPGSLAIPPAIAAVINNILLFDMNAQQAVNYPRAFAISRNSKIGATLDLTIEAPRFPEDVKKALLDYGYVFKDVGEYNMATGGIAVIYRDKEQGIFYAGADSRRGYKALAY